MKSNLFWTRILFLILILTLWAVTSRHKVIAATYEDDQIETNRDMKFDSDLSSSTQENAVLPDSLQHNEYASSTNSEFNSGYIDPNVATDTYQSTTTENISTDQSENSNLLTSQDNLPAFAPTEKFPTDKLLQVNDDGSVTIRGVILASDSVSRLLIKSWGGLWNVIVNINTSIVPQNENDHVFNIESAPIGHFIGVQGYVDTNNPYSINAEYIRDWSMTPAVPNTGTNNSPDSEAAVDNSQNQEQQLFIGTASEIGYNAFTLSNGDGVNYRVNIDSSTIIWSDDRVSINFSDIETGDVVRVSGRLEGTSITPLVVRDTSK
jgi:hypothetical protein